MAQFRPEWRLSLLRNGGSTHTGLAAHSEPENSATYKCDLFRWENGTKKTVENYILSNPEIITLPGYEVLPGDYQVVVTTQSENYASSNCIYDFVVSDYRYKTDSFSVSVNKTVVYETQHDLICTVNAEGAAAILYYQVPYCYDYNSERLDEDGFATFSLYPAYTDSNEKENIYSFTFCVVYDGVWSEWTDPVEVLYITPDPLTEAKINLPEIIEAGKDFTFSFESVENATSYCASISEYYSEQDIFSNYSAQPDTPMTVKGYDLAPGKYCANVYAYSEIYGDSYKTVVFSTAGQRADAPAVTTDNDEYTSGDMIHFQIDTQETEELYITYKYYKNAGSWSGNTNIIPTGSITTWDFIIPEQRNGYTFEFKFSVKRDGKWTKWKTIKKIAGTASS